MGTMLDKLFSATSFALFSRVPAARRRRQAMIDVRGLSTYVQRDIGLLDGDEEIPRGFGKT